MRRPQLELLVTAAPRHGSSGSIRAFMWAGGTGSTGPGEYFPGNIHWCINTYKLPRSPVCPDATGCKLVFICLDRHTSRIRSDIRHKVVAAAITNITVVRTVPQGEK